MITTRFAAQLETKAESLRAELERKPALPTTLNLFSHLSQKDLRWLEKQLNVQTNESVEYWCALVSKFNMSLISRKEVRRWQTVETILGQTTLTPKALGKTSLLFIYFRLAETDNAALLPNRRARKKKAEVHLRSVKRKAKALPIALDETEALVAQLISDISSYTQEPFSSLCDMLGSLQEANRRRVEAIMDLTRAVADLDTTEEPLLLQEIDALLLPDAKDRAYEYTIQEKAALLTLENVLVEEKFSGNKAAKLMAEIWNTMGPIREQWELGDRHQALRRSLRNWKKELP